MKKRILGLVFFLLIAHSFAQTNKKDIKKSEKISREGDAMLTSEEPNYYDALDLYLKAQELYEDNAFLNFKIGACYLNTIQKTKAVPYLEKAIELDPNVNSEVHFLMGKAYQLNYQFDKAIAEFTKYKESLSPREINSKQVLSILYYIMAEKRKTNLTEKTNIDNPFRLAEKHIEECKTGKELVKTPADAKITNLGSAVNTVYPEYAPVISADESVMYFTSRRINTTGGKKDPGDGQYFEDIYVTYNNDGKWSAPTVVSEPINTVNHDAAIGLSADGQTLFLYKDENGGDIYYCRLKGDKWGRPKRMSDEINSPFSEKSISLSADERTLFFVSDRPGGAGGRDIYTSTKDKKGNWGRAKNLGTVINSAYDEDGVFFHPDGKTLYFSSKGHNNMGGYDIFKSVLTDGKWSTPENLGYPINTADDDIFFVLNGKGDKGYYASVKKNGFGDQDLYVIDMPKPKMPAPPPPPPVAQKEEATPAPPPPPPPPANPLTILTGVVTDAFNHAPLEAKIQLVDNVKNEVIAEFYSNEKTGKYLVTLPSGKNYGIEVEKDGFLFHSENFDIPPTTDYQEVRKDVEMKKIAVGSKVVLKNIFFDFDKATLREESGAELDHLAGILNEIPKMKIEISGHTDNKGNADYNKKLSEARAKAVMDYLIKHGIRADRLTFAGYGMSKPLAPNTNADGTDNPENRQLNRRTEFEIKAN